MEPFSVSTLMCSDAQGFGCRGMDCFQAPSSNKEGS